MATDAQVDQAFKRFIRSKPCVAAASGNCSGRVEFMHHKHAGMGGTKQPVLGNGVPGCSGHHTQRADSYHRGGRSSFELKNGISMALICAWYAGEFDGDFLQIADEPPTGAL